MRNFWVGLVDDPMSVREGLINEKVNKNYNLVYYAQKMWEKDGNIKYVYSARCIKHEEGSFL